MSGAMHTVPTRPRPRPRIPWDAVAAVLSVAAMVVPVAVVLLGVWGAR